MALKITDLDNRVIDSRIWNSLKCEGCGQEILIPPNARDKIVCPYCRKANDKLEFMPLARTQWVSRHEWEKEHSEDYRFSSIRYYRQAVQFRRAIFRLYDRQCYINWAQAIALLIAFHIDVTNGVLKLLEGNRNNSLLRYPNGSFESFLRQFDKEKETTSDQDPFGYETFGKVIVSLLGEIEIKRSRGNQARSDTLILMLDAIFLRLCPNSYLHLLRDALRLRSAEYKKIDRNGACAKRKAWDRFYKAKRGVEASCRRIWKSLFNDSPPSLGGSEYPRVVRGKKMRVRQGMMSGG